MWYLEHREEILAKEAAYRKVKPAWKRIREKRLEAMRAYGGKCARCGFADWRALQFDHLNGEGAEDRRLHRHNNPGYYDYVLKRTDIFQLLCANCNWIKRYERMEHNQRGWAEYEDASIRSSANPNP